MIYVYFYNNEETSCQSNCKFSDYSMESQYLKCDCDVTNTEINTKEIAKFSAKSIYQSFFSVLKYSNYKVLKCSKLAFTIKSFTINIGSIITIIYFIIFLIFLLIYIIKGMNQLKIDISKNIKEKVEKNNIYKKQGNIEIIKSFKELKNFKQNMKTKNKKQENQIILRNTKRKRKGFQRIIFAYPPKKSCVKVIGYEVDSKNKINDGYSNYDNKNNILVTNKTNSLNSMKQNKEIREKSNINQQIFDIMKFNEKEREHLDGYELNNLEYDSSKILDKRNFIETYWSLLKREHLVIFTFITKDDHNIIFVKYPRFVFLLCTDMAMNVFFFSDETMHKMYLDYGKYNFIQQIPQIAYSTLISKLIEIFLCYLSMTDTHYYQIKDCKKISKSSMIGIYLI